MKKYDLVAFDLDGTLVDTFPFIISSYKYALQTLYGVVTESDESIKSQIGIPVKQFFKAHPQKDREKLVELYVNHNDLSQKNGVPFFDGVKELLFELKKITKVGIITSKRKEPLLKWITQVGFENFFDVIVAKEDTLKNKPEPDPVLFAINSLDIQPNRALYVGDSRFDVMSAHSAKVDACVVGWACFDYEYFKDLNPKYYVKDCKEILEIVKG